MAGFPNRPNRTTFGPPLVNVRPVTQPDKELDADAVNLAWWQVAGTGRVLPLVVLIYNGATTARVYQGLAWDSAGKLAAIPAVKNTTGQYTFTFASTYLDENGRAISFAPKAAVAFPQGAAAQVQAVAVVSGQTVAVRVQTAAPADVDATFILLVW